MENVTIIGLGRGWEDAPLNCISWGITQLNLRRPVKKVIDMNDYSLWGHVQARDAERSREKAKTDGAIYIDRGNYPLDSIASHFGTDYFSSTVDYALALAIWEGVKSIDLYGIQMLVPGEYSYQKPGADFWCGVAIGKGVKVRIHGDSTIMKTRDGKLYGYGTPQR